MRIISTFTDYYDSVQGLGIDKSCVFKREESQKHVAGLTPVIQFMIKQIYSARFHVSEKLDWNNKNMMTLRRFVIGYCGTLIRVYKFKHYRESEIIEEKFIYHPDKAFEYFKKYQSLYSTYSNLAKTYYKKEMMKCKSTPQSIEIATRPISTELGDFFQDLQAPLFVYPAGDCPSYNYENTPRRGGYRPMEQIEIFRNPKLKDMEFFACKDPFTCYQNIYQYLSGVLTQRDDIETPMTEKDKVNQHGFDQKYGFRTRPGSKKKRKKKKNR